MISHRIRIDSPWKHNDFAVLKARVCQGGKRGIWEGFYVSVEAGVHVGGVHVGMHGNARGCGHG